jgi:hypothetical protein
MKRREFLTLLGGAAAAWPLAARAQQSMPLVGFVSGGAADANVGNVAAFRKGLNEAGYVESQNVTVDYHWLEGQYNRLPIVNLFSRHDVLGCNRNWCPPIGGEGQMGRPSAERTAGHWRPASP